MRRSRIFFVLLLLLAPNVAPAQSRHSASFAKLAEEFVFTTLAFSPANATQTGLHERRDPATGQRVILDQMLDDYSRASIERQRRYYERVRVRLAAIPSGRLDPQTRADYELLQNATAYALFALTRERAYTWKPQMYPELLGSALFSNISLEYGDTTTRARDLAARLEKVPKFVDDAISNLEASNDVFRRVALESVDGVADLIKGMGAGFVKGTPSASRYSAAQPAALAALERYSRFVRDDLPKKQNRDWRMGSALFSEKWKYYLQVSKSPAEMLRAAEDSMGKARAEMLVLAMPLHAQWFGNHDHAALGADARLSAIVGEVMARIGNDHTHRDSLVEQATRDAIMLQKFVVDRRLMSITDFSNLRIIPTPLFMRGIYGVAGAVFAPALQPHLSTFYWVTPIAKDWAEDRAESKLREYNRYKMLTLTIHEAIPGHTVQGDYANRVTPEWRRILRSVFGNGPYIEGWAVYAEHMMEDMGINGGDPVKARLTRLKGMLRIYANAIIDVRLHTMGMPGQAAVDLMMRQAFQERPEAEGKLQRAQLDYVQLNMYFVGVQEWTTLRRDAQRKEGGHFNLCSYHDRVLLYGPVPVPTVRRLYMAGVKPTAKAPPSRCEEGARM